MTTEQQVFHAAIRMCGEKHQEDIAVEECSELIQAILHKRRCRPHNIPEEIADVEIALEQLKIINDCHHEVLQIRKAKIDRLKKKMDKEEVKSHGRERKIERADIKRSEN